MTSVARRILATIVIVTFVIVYGLLAMEVGAVVSAVTGTFGQFLYFVIAGLVWVIPAGAVVSWGWRNRGPKAR